MSEASLVLFIDLEPGKKIDLRVAARAAIAWADLIENVGAHFDPLSPPSVKLESSAPGSQKLKAIIETLSEDPKAAIRAAVASAFIGMVGVTSAWTWEQVLEWIFSDDAPKEVVELSGDEKRLIAQEVKHALDSRVAESKARRVYDELGADPSVTGVGMSGTAEKRPDTVIPRNDFPIETFLVEEDGFEKRSHVEEVDLVLERAVLTNDTKRKWGFISAHGKISASIKDEGFLERLSTGQLNVGMSGGIIFRVELEVFEERRDDIWMVKEYVVVKVLTVTPPSQQARFELE